jgi:hypothetical protein
MHFQGDCAHIIAGIRRERERGRRGRNKKKKKIEEGEK